MCRPCERTFKAATRPTSNFKFGPIIPPPHTNSFLQACKASSHTQTTTLVYLFHLKRQRNEWHPVVGGFVDAVCTTVRHKGARVGVA